MSEEVYVVGWLYEPGMPLAHAILFADERADFVQVVSVTPHPQCGVGWRIEHQTYKEWLKEYARS